MLPPSKSKAAFIQAIPSAAATRWMMSRLPGRRAIAGSRKAGIPSFRWTANNPSCAHTVKSMSSSTGTNVGLRPTISGHFSAAQSAASWPANIKRRLRGIALKRLRIAAVGRGPASAPNMPRGSVTSTVVRLELGTVGSSFSAIVEYHAYITPVVFNRSRLTWGWGQMTDKHSVSLMIRYAVEEAEEAGLLFNSLLAQGCSRKRLGASAEGRSGRYGAQ